MTRVLAKDTPNSIDNVVSVSGWVHSRRDHGGLIFIDVRDHTGIVQLVFNPEPSDSFVLAEECRDEFVVKASGTVREREEGLRNDKIETGSVEIVVDTLEILNRAEALPYPAVF